MSGQFFRLSFAFLVWVQFGLMDSWLHRNSSLLGAPIAFYQEKSGKSEQKKSKRSATDDKPQSDEEQNSESLLFSSDFESGLNQWEFSDPKAWKLDRILGSNEPMIRQFMKASNYSPKHRSPLHQAILKDHQFGSFELTVIVRSTHESYGHRDACLFFGYQNPNQFYYVHLGQATDPHCNQIFIVNHADRTKITLTTNEGTPWDEDWHQVRIVRYVESGKIEVYFDDQTKPTMTAEDKTFAEGRIGIGSFDDTADWMKLRVRKLADASADAPQAGIGAAVDGQ